MRKRILVIAGVLAVLAIMAVPIAVSASPITTGTGSTEISGDVPIIVNFAAPAAITEWATTLGGTPSSTTFVLGNNYSQTATPGSVTTNDSNGVAVTVASDRTDGCMVSGSNKLATALSVSTGGYSGAVKLGDTDAVYSTGSQVSGHSISLSVEQTLLYTDPIATGYSLTLTYTATAQ